MQIKKALLAIGLSAATLISTQVYASSWGPWGGNSSSPWGGGNSWGPWGGGRNSWTPWSSGGNSWGPWGGGRNSWTPWSGGSNSWGPWGGRNNRPGGWNNGWNWNSNSMRPWGGRNSSGPWSGRRGGSAYPWRRDRYWEELPWSGNRPWDNSDMHMPWSKKKHKRPVPPPGFWGRLRHRVRGPHRHPRQTLRAAQLPQPPGRPNNPRHNAPSGAFFHYRQA